MSGDRHVPVLLGPVLEGLGIREDGVYVDATFGRGGHSSAILERLGETGRLVAIDRDPDAVAAAPDALMADPRFEILRNDFAQLETCIAQRNLTGRIDGLLLDLGVSSPQLDRGERGFSFLHDGPLDMRMDPDAGISAADFINTVDEQALKKILQTLGEEPRAARIARAIVTARDRAPIETTGQLAAIVAGAAPARAGGRHPATRSFQALRIHVNRELEQLRAVLDQSLAVLAAGGRLCVISFHSLEDRIVKRFIRRHAQVPEPWRGMPDVPAAYRPRLVPVGKVITADAAEIAANPRARSAHLRVAERT
ncbi:MAG: 16S rRNA (cytosine(1402)-N(4))-methyltransferase RsmH [Woeseiaceae bacterium]|nr:16S rRNA (cytosine(1402)-N(4))-methyltransferase RsmH [Woeseiaceae bacterium]